MISLKHIVKSYTDGDNRNQVLCGVDLEVAAGESVAIMGASGSGKTTLLNIIGGLDQDYEGDVLISGKRITGLKDGALSRYRNQTVSFVFQQFHLLPHMSVIDNVMMPTWFRGFVSDENATERARSVLSRVGVEHKEHVSPNQLSGGEKQRAAIARALFSRPKILLCDEPTGALDATNGNRVLSLFDRLHQEDGLTLIVVTHNPDVAARCQRIVSIDKGVLASPSGGAA